MDETQTEDQTTFTLLAQAADLEPIPWARPLPRGPPDAPPTTTPTLYIHVRGEKIREKDSLRFTIRSHRQALISLRGG